MYCIQVPKRNDCQIIHTLWNIPLYERPAYYWEEEEKTVHFEKCPSRHGQILNLRLTKPRAHESCSRLSVAVWVPWRCTVSNTAPDSRASWCDRRILEFERTVSAGVDFLSWLKCTEMPSRCFLSGVDSNWTLSPLTRDRLDLVVYYPDSGFMITLTCPKTKLMYTCSKFETCWNGNYHHTVWQNKLFSSWKYTVIIVNWAVISESTVNL